MLNSNYNESFDGMIRRNSWLNLVEEQSEKSFDTSAQPLPSLCNLKKARLDQDFGFKLYIDKNNGPLIGNVEVSSPAERCGLRPGDFLITVNDITVRNLNYKEIKTLLTDTGTDCRILVINELGAEWYKSRNMEIPLQYGAVLPSPVVHDIIHRTDSMSFISLSSSTKSAVPTKNGVVHAKDSCFSLPWRSRRVIMIIIILFGCFLSASICGSLIHRFAKKLDIFTIQWVDVQDQSVVHVLNLNLEKPAPIFELDSPTFMSNMKTTLFFEKKVLLHKSPQLNWCFVTQLNSTNISDEDILEEGARRAAKRLRAIQVEEDWNFKASVMDKNNFSNLQESCGQHYILIERYKTFMGNIVYSPGSMTINK